MRIEHINEMDLSEADEREIARLLEASFATDFGDRSYFMQRHNLRLVFRDPQIVGHMALDYRTIRQGEALLPIVGVADVASDPQRRGEGIASQLLDAAITRTRKTRASFMLLFGDARLYAAKGFRPIENRLRYVEFDGTRTGTVQDKNLGKLMMLPIGDHEWDEDKPIDLVGHLF